MTNYFQTQSKIVLSIASALFISTVSMAQPNQGDLSVYEGGIGTVASSEDTILPNLLFIADTSGSMDDYVAVEYNLTKDAYDSTFDYGGDGNAADDDYIYVYEDIETFSGVTISPEQNKCDALLTTYSNSPEYPLFTGKVLQWKPQEGEVVISEGTVCETTSVSPATLAVNSQAIGSNWTQLVTSPSIRIFEDDLASGSSITMTISNTGSKHATGGVYYYGMDSSGNYNGNDGWLCSRNKWNKNQTKSCTGYVDDIPETYYEITFWLDGKNGSTTANGEISYNLGASGEVQVDPSCVASDPVTSDEVVDGEWSGALETSDDPDYILECESDSGEHGYSGSADPYVQFCGSASCTSPRYVSSSGIDWNSEGLTDKFFYNGNYHDYLNYTPDAPDFVYDTREKWYVEERDDDDWDTSTSRSVESFCNLIDDYGIFASDDDDPSTWRYYDHPLNTPLYVTDSDDGTGFIYECKQKNSMMINALTDMVSSMTEVNMGLMRFNGGSGGYILSALADIDEGTNRTDLLSKISNLPAAGSTPLTETLYEAYLYLSGKNEKYSTGSADSDAFISSGSSTYKSPIEHSCQSNNIIYLTDGKPTNDTGSNDLIEDLPGVGNCYTSGDYTESTNSCLDDLAEYMATDDVNGSIDGENTVNTYTIGFNIDLELMAAVAEKGSGEYYTAVSYDDLMDSFQEILLNIALSEPSTLVAPAVSVNAFNELQHRNQIYYATFTPTFDPAWQGNVKRYGITSDAVVYGQAGTGVSVIGDDGFFKSSAQSFWSDFPDGAYVEEGGYREQLTNSRTIYVDGSSLEVTQSGIVALDSSKSFDPDNLESDANAETATIYADEADEIRDWLLGVDVADSNGNNDFTEAHRYGADSLHSKPFVVTYSGTSEDDANDILFLTNNMGIITAVDARPTMGTELWSYIPEEFLDNLKIYKDNDSSLRHWQAYGLDGEATLWTEESETSTADAFDVGTVYMYQGMRRGGRNYYAWDISNADMTSSGAPISNLWSSPIQGGEGQFSDLGYTWSKMVRTKIRWGCTDKYTNAGCETRDVLVFSGGYDGAYDNDSTTLYDSDTVDGDAVYIVDALTGNYLWSAGNHSGHSVYKDSSDDGTLEMYNSIPGDPSPIDIDGDGDMDMLFVVDISGKIFRFDFDQTHTGGSGSGYATGGMIANLTEAGGVARRFYNGLDIALQVPEGSTPYLTISVGSGYRAGPKLPEAWSNQFYVIIDETLSGAPFYIDEDTEAKVISYEYVEDTTDSSSRSVITQSDLFAYTGDAYVRGKQEGKDYGFYRSFSEADSEKVLQSSITFAGNITIATYTPVEGVSATEETCGSGEIGGGRIYQFNAISGESTLPNGVEYITTGEGIPADIALLILPPTEGDDDSEGGIVACYGTDCRDDLFSTPIGTATRTYWRE